MLSFSRVLAPLSGGEIEPIVDLYSSHRENVRMKIILITSLFLFVSCSTSLYLPQGRMISPEAQGKLGAVSLEARIEQFQKDKADFSNHNIKHPLKERTPVFRPTGHGEMGFLEKLDLYADANILLNAPSVLGVKFQILGDSRLEAKEKNFSLAVTGGVGRQKGKNAPSGGTTIKITWPWGNGEEEKSDAIDRISFQTIHQEAGLISGYRWKKNLLHYASATYFHQEITGHVKTEDKVLNKRFNFTQDGMMYATGLIIYFGERYYGKLEYSHITSGFSFARERSLNAGNAGLGITF